MKSLIYIFLLCVSTITAQTKYEQGMRKAFELWGADKTEEASNLFERISTAEKDKWLPHYYVAQIAIIKNWKDFDNREEATLKANLDKAQEYLNNASSITADNVYITYLQAQLYTVWVAHDGMKYGMKYAGKIGQMYQEIIDKHPDNPLFIAAKASWDMGSARYFGKPVTPYCKELQRAIKLFATFKPETEFHPKGSVAPYLETVKQCNE